MLNRIKIITLFLLPIIFCVSGCMGPGSAYRARPVPSLQTDDPNAHLQMAEKYLHKFFQEDTYYLDNLDIVVRESNETLRLAPHMAEAHYFLGYGNALKGMIINDESKIKTGLSEYYKSIEQSPNLGNSDRLPPLPYFLAKFYSEKDTAKAIQYAQEAIKINPGIVAPHFLLALIYSTQEKYQLALQEYRAAADISPEHMDVMKGLAMTYVMIVKSAAEKKQISLYENVIPKAIAAARNSVRLAPDDMLVHEALGVLYGAAGLYDLKIFEFHSIIEKKATANAYYELGSAYLGKNNLIKAEQCFQKALDLNQGNNEARFAIAYCYYLKNEDEKACENFKRFFKTAKSPNAYKAIWYYYSILASGNSKKADNFLKKYSKSFEGDQWEKVLLDYHIGQHEDDYLLSRTTLRFDLCEAYYYMGCRYFHKGNKKQATECFQKSLDTKIYDYFEYFGSRVRLSQLH